MVGPVGDDERAASDRRIKVAFTVLVGASAGLITLQGDASIALTGGAVVAGLALGWGLAWYLYPDGAFSSDPHQRRRFD